MGRRLVIEPGFCFLAAVAVLVVPLPWLMGLLLAASIHELGHYLALKICSVPVHCLRLTIRGAILEIGPVSGWVEIFCALAGPGAGMMLIWAARWLPRTALCGIVQGAWNLLPIGQRDGGRAVRQICVKLGAGEWVFPMAENLAIAAVVITCFCFRRLGIWAAMPAGAIAIEKFLAKCRMKDYNRPTIDKEVRL